MRKALSMLFLMLCTAVASAQEETDRTAIMAVDKNGYIVFNGWQCPDFTV